ncbi:MAG: 50S ribosomal protein L13 [Planctomycetes bacterium]|nr:50S ribosomal protein L13 [Planctomycetota bacterium]
MKTTVLKKEAIARRWLHVDASGEILGRMAVEIARLLMGKHRVDYTPGLDAGDYVIVTNARKIRVTGRKLQRKKYYHYTGYLGGQRERTLEQMLARTPGRVIMLAVRRMLPKNRLGRQMLRKLKVYPGEDHPHQAQQPITVSFTKDRVVSHGGER